jgi:predicted nucleic acid-binding protein
VKVVVNATPLIALSLLDKLDLLPRLFDEILVPTAVYEEIVVKGVGRPGSDALADASWIQVRSPKATSSVEPMLLGLDPGELQTLLLAQEIKPDWVLIDERLGRRVAQAMEFRVKGTVGVLLAGFHAGLISKKDALKAVRELVDKGIRIGPGVIAWFESELDED